MTNNDLIDHISNCAGITKAQAKRALDCMQQGIITGLKDSGELRLRIGSFTVAERRARLGRNPRTGEALSISARKVVKFKASKILKEGIGKTNTVSRDTF